MYKTQLIYLCDLSADWFKIENGKVFSLNLHSFHEEGSEDVDEPVLEDEGHEGGDEAGKGVHKIRDIHSVDTYLPLLESGF